MKYLVRDVSRHGQARYYVRAPGQRKIRIRVPPEHRDFEAHYKAALRGIDLSAGEATSRQRPRRQERTFGWLCAQYYASPDFAELHPTTQTKRRAILDSCCLEETKPGSGILLDSCPLDEFGPPHVRLLRDRKRSVPHAANGRLKALRRLFVWALEASHVTTSNPVRDVARLKIKSEGHHAWTLDEVRAYERRHPIGTRARLALGLFLFTAQRISDVAHMGPSHIENGWLRLVQAKNRANKPVTIEIPILPALQHLIDNTIIGDETFLVTEHAKPFASVKACGKWFRKRCDEAGLKHCSAHGLRKAAAALLIDLGCTREEVMAVTGHVTHVELERYIRSRDRRLLAERAMEKLSAATSDHSVATSA
jgi:integrase